MIAARRRTYAEPLDLRYVLLRFVDGRVVDPRRCPRHISASSHWVDAGRVVDAATGANTICGCGDAA